MRTINRRLELPVLGKRMMAAAFWGHSAYLQGVALFITHRHGHLHVLGCLLFPFVKLPMDQGDVNVVANVSYNVTAQPVNGAGGRQF